MDQLYGHSQKKMMELRKILSGIRSFRNKHGDVFFSQVSKVFVYHTVKVDIGENWFIEGMRSKEASYPRRVLDFTCD